MDDFLFSMKLHEKKPTVLLLENDPGEVLRIKALLHSFPTLGDQKLLHLSSLSVALNYLHSQTTISLILTATTLPDALGVEVVKLLRDAAPSARILTFSNHQDHLSCHQLKLAGANDCLDKNTLVEKFGNVLHQA